MAKLKQAKEEAEKESAEFRAHMEVDFQRKLAEVSAEYMKIKNNLSNMH